jgi:sterol desaturase/sphingolipid hydroxylase (fatty acid hydroxylase superfamily)
MSAAELYSINSDTKKTKVSRKRKQPTAKVTRARRKHKTSWFTPRNALIGMTLAFLALSLTHLADGIAYLAHCSEWQAIALAVGIDCMFCERRSDYLNADQETKARIRADAWAMTFITITASSALNGLAFYVTADETLKYYAGAFGLVIQFLIYGATQILSKLSRG